MATSTTDHAKAKHPTAERRAVIPVLCAALLAVIVVGLFLLLSAHRHGEAKAERLTGSAWRLTGITRSGTPLDLNRTTLVISFLSGGRLTARTNINFYNGSYQVSGDKVTMRSDTATAAGQSSTSEADLASEALYAPTGGGTSVPPTR